MHQSVVVRAVDLAPHCRVHGLVTEVHGSRLASDDCRAVIFTTPVLGICGPSILWIL